MGEELSWMPTLCMWLPAWHDGVLRGDIKATNGQL